MKILFLNYEFPPLGGGASHFSYSLAKKCVELGNKVSVITMGYKDLPFYEKKEGIDIYRIPSFRKKKEISNFLEMLFYLFFAKKFLKNHLKNNCYYINHTHFIVPTGILSMWLKNKYKIPYIITSHGSDVPKYNPDRFVFLHIFIKKILKKICNNASKIISPSEYLKFLILKNIDKDIKEKIEVICNGIDTKKFIPLKKEKIILSTGRLLKRKGFQYLIKAFLENKNDYKLHIVGDGPMKKYLTRIAKNRKQDIIFHGWINNNSKEYLELLGKSEIYFLLSSRENSSISLLEAMSSGCAIVSSKESGAYEMIKNIGIGVNPKNITEINLVIDKINKDKSYYCGISREEVLKKYNIEITAKKYLKIYEDFAHN